jgi:lipid II:glycine glycyltransferase (peptidoglycan interpeptide bridge formation enzyme)
LPAAYAILWEAILEGKRRGCRWFNFWGVVGDDQENHPWFGLSRFKKGFGGEEVWYLHARDYPLSWRYWPVWALETWRRRKRGL